MQRASRILGIAAATALMCSAAWAQGAFPNQTVKFVVPSAAGSTTDALARIMADRLGRMWNRGTIVENLAGGAMNIGSRAVARAIPDGHTLMVAPPAPLGFSHLLSKDIGYEPTKFVPITLLAKIPNVLVMRKTIAANNLNEFIAYAKANPGKVSYASSGAGSTAHLTALLLQERAGLKMNHVPYRGAAPALTDLIGGHVDIFFDTLATSVPQYRSGAVKLLGVGDTTRNEVIAEVPTLAEAGLPGFRSTTWFGLVAPPGTPKAVANKINADAVAVLKDPEVVAQLKKLSLTPGATSPAESAKFFAEEAAQWSKVIKDSGIAAK
jgi:tripartite-type tricarboxylate transporter receptor subunit TctC